VPYASKVQTGPSSRGLDRLVGLKDPQGEMLVQAEHQAEW